MSPEISERSFEETVECGLSSTARMPARARRTSSAHTHGYFRCLIG